MIFFEINTIHKCFLVPRLKIKNIFRKCSLTKTISQEEIEAKYAEINYYFTGKENDIITGFNQD